MPSIHEYRRNTASIAKALGRLDRNATPAQEEQLFDSLSDREIDDMAIELLTRMGADGYHQPAAA